VKVKALVVILVAADGCDGPTEIAHPLVFFGDDIQRFYAVAVVDAGEFALVVEVVEDLVAFHDIGGDVAGGEFGVVVKEAFAVDQDPGDGLALGGDIAAGVHLYTR